MEMESLIDRVSSEGDARCAHLAYTNLEQSVMWAVKGVSIALGSRK